MKFVVIDPIGGALWHTVEMEDLLDGTYLVRLHDKEARITPTCYSNGVPMFEIWALTTQLRKQNLISNEGTVSALSSNQIVSKSVSESLNDEEIRQLRGRELYDSLRLTDLAD